ncbi:hypothetical protein ABZT17_32910 [Streptomyces sp. NPDC005648]|uniref:hypothetical protein n=1 Tax=Streptomyces sp. NPDC005648 TaxID=3157044 RepID=UPI0033A4F778
MSFFARASWPGDHRDEIVAGALVAAVVVVLGYASGIGVSPPPTVDTAAPPVSRTPSPTRQPTSRSETGPPDTSAGTAGAGAGAAGGYWAGGGDAGIPVAGGTSPTTGGTGGHDHGGGEGSGSAGGGSGTDSPSPSPTPAPSPPAGCQDGQVSLVKPLLNGVATPVTGLLGGLLAPSAAASASPSPSPSPAAGTDTLSSLCVGLASPSVLSELLP